MLLRLQCLLNDPTFRPLKKSQNILQEWLLSARSFSTLALVSSSRLITRLLPPKRPLTQFLNFHMIASPTHDPSNSIAHQLSIGRPESSRQRRFHAFHTQCLSLFLLILFINNTHQHNSTCNVCQYNCINCSFLVLLHTTIVSTATLLKPEKLAWTILQQAIGIIARFFSGSNANFETSQRCSIVLLLTFHV